MFNYLISTVYASATDIVGTISVPTGVPSEITSTTVFISGIIKFLMVLAGLYSLWQFLTGGFSFITSGGEKAKITEAQQKIQMSIIGLVVMTASFIIIAIVSKILFDKFDFILNPQLEVIK